MTGFISTVRFLVKENSVCEFINRHNAPEGIDQAGIGLKQYVIRTGDGGFTWIGMFKSESAIAEARPHLIEQLDKIRDLLEEISSELGISDASSGPVVWSN
jgi:hypothetical protein